MFTSAFQLTRSRGAWRICWSQTKDGQNFNSHAHVERDVTLIFEISAKSISTHTLTWSVTVCEQEVKGYFKDFNSHAHVERDNRVTWNYLHMVNFNSHAHVERDSMGFWGDLHKIHFNSHAHVERDLSCTAHLLFFLHFNSHAHVERDSTHKTFM